MAKALLVNYRWCTGCHSCELACQIEHGLEPGVYGIKVNKIGPFQIGPKEWVLENYPVITKQCSFCGKRLAEGKAPSCVQHCQTSCLQILDAAEAARIAAENPHMLCMTR